MQRLYSGHYKLQFGKGVEGVVANAMVPFYDCPKRVEKKLRNLV
jgi:hypothetical protein